MKTARPAIIDGNRTSYPAPFMPRPIAARIDLSALEHNLQVARRNTSARVMAVIKADAYGHGLLRCAEALRPADGLAVLDIGDALRLRGTGYRQTILMLEGCFTPDDLPLMVEHDLACVIHSPHQLAMLDACPNRKAISAWLKVNTGMNRLGFPLNEVAAVMEKLKSHPAVRDITLMTHFASADGEPGVSAELERFNQVAAPYRVARSLANSAALLRHLQTHGDWVRPGIMLYGASPFENISAEKLGLKPVMTLTSEIIAAHELKAGECIGYGASFCADSTMRIGTVACGYADGYPRHASTGTPALVDGQRTRTLGRVSMDMLCVDLNHIPQADVGSKVTLWGKGLSVDEVARAAGTIGYELLCAVAARVPRITA
jgi:alanine racemase